MKLIEFHRGESSLFFRATPNLKLFYRLKYMTVLCLSFLGCSEYPVYNRTTIESQVEILGKESCHQDVEKNFWLLNIEATTGPKKIVGTSINFKGNTYRNVVKTNFNLSKYENKKKKYYIITGDEITSSPYPCSISDKDITPPESNKIPTISIVKIDTLSRGF